MKILVVSNLYPPDFLGGYEIGCMRAVNYLMAAGHVVKVLTTKSKVRVPSEELHVCRELRLSDIYRTKADTRAQIGARLFSEENRDILDQHLRADDWDVVYVFNLLGLGALQLIDTLNSNSTPWVWHLMDRIPYDALRDVPATALGLFESGATRSIKASSFLLMSRRLRSEIADCGISLDGKVAYIPGWYADGEEEFKATPLERDASGSCTFVAIGSLSPEKGTLLILEAASILKHERDLDLKVDLYGPGPIEKYSEQISGMKLESTVEIRPAIAPKEVAKRLQEYDCFLFPTWSREPFGFVALEAAALGLVPIITVGAGVTEVLSENTHYLPVERDARSLADKMELIIKDASLRKNISAASQNYVRSEFRLSDIGKKIESELADAATLGGLQVSPMKRSAVAAIRQHFVTKILQHDVGYEALERLPAFAGQSHEERAKEEVRTVRKKVRARKPRSLSAITAGVLMAILRVPIFHLIVRIVELEARVKQLEAKS